MIGLCQVCGPIIGDRCVVCLSILGRCVVQTEGQLDELEACEVVALLDALIDREEERSRRALARFRQWGRTW